MSLRPGNFFGDPPAAEPEPAPDEAPPQSAPPVEREKRWTPRALYRFFERLGISEDTVTAFGCYVVMHAFPASGDTPAGEYAAIAVPFLAHGVETNRLLRPPSGAPELHDDPGVPMAFNVLSIETPDMVWVCESEIEAMALVEAGYRQVIALYDDPTSRHRRFPALHTHAEQFSTIKHFVLVSTRNVRGETWREDLAARLGRHRCLTVEWPVDCLRASDVLARPDGADALQAAVNAATPYPIEGLQRFDAETMAALRRRAPPQVMTTGNASTDMIGLRFPTEGRLIIVTGIPNAGKSLWLRHVMLHLMRVHGRRFAVFTPEMSPWQEFVASCIEAYLRKRFWRRRGVHPEDIMSDDELETAANWLGQRMTILTVDTLDGAPELDWVLDRGAMAVLRDDATDLVLDPWNEIDDGEEGNNAASNANRRLQQCKAFAGRHRVNVWIVAHPKLLRPDKPGGRLGPPGGYDINGGAAWANKADLGITVHRPNEATEIHVWKSKHLRWGRRGTVATVHYDINTGHYYDDPAQGRFPDADAS